MTSDYLTANDILAITAGQADHRIRYGEAPSQFIDLRIPNDSEGPYPVVAILHGGCWVKDYASLDYFAPVAEALRAEGYAVWNIEYRCVDETGGAWPGTFQDVGVALDMLRDCAADYALDPGRVIAIGHSAGGHLALWSAGRDKISVASPLYTENPLSLNGVIAMAGPGDLDSVRDHMAGPCGGDYIRELMAGTKADVPDHYAAGSPVELLPLGTEQILITGRHDPVVPVCYGDDFVAKARAAGDRATHIIVEDAAHHEFGKPGSPVWQPLLGAITKLMGVTS